MAVAQPSSRALRHDESMTRITKRIVLIAASAAIVLACLIPQALAAPSSHWSRSRCALQQATFNVRHPHPNGRLEAGGNRILKRHGCGDRVPGPKRWSKTQCADYQATFMKLYASPSNKRVATANGALKHHGCRQRVSGLPQGY
jgi:hypothetical protein